MPSSLPLHWRAAASRIVGVRAAGVAAFVMAAACSGCGPDATAPLSRACVSMAVAPASRTVLPGDTARFNVVFASCSSIRPVTWSVAEPGVATIVAADGHSVLVRGLAYGSTTLVAQAQDDPAVRATSLLTVFYRSLAPPTLDVRGASRVVSVGGAPALEVTASVSNRSTVNLRMGAGPLCPYITIIPDPTGEPISSTNASMACPMDPNVVLAPGDSIVLTRVLPADSLARFAAGTYGVNVTVRSDDYLTGTWAGAIQLPLSRAP